MIVSNRVAFWDGDNFVIVTKNCTKEHAQRILDALNKADLMDTQMAPAAEAEPLTEPEEIMPVIPDDLFTDPEPGEIRFSSGKYAGLTPWEVLEQYKDKGYGNLSFLAMKGIPEALKVEIRVAQDAYFKKRFEKSKDPFKDVSSATMDFCKTFFLYFDNVLSDEQKNSIAEQAGYIDFKTFLENASLEQLQSLIASIISENVTK